ncbi:MAG: hypothetical protein V4536_08510, partial [Pseudomonadota bacterium]
MSDKTMPTNTNAAIPSEVLGTVNVMPAPKSMPTKVSGAKATSTMVLVEDGTGSSIRIEREIKAGQLNKIEVSSGKKYRVLNADKQVGIDGEQLQDDVIAVRRNQNLELTYPNGTMVELAGFFQADGAGADFDAATSITLPGDGETIKVLSSEGATSGSITGATETTLTSNSTLLYAHGDSVTLMQMTQGNDVLAHALATQSSVMAEVAPSHSGSSLAWMGGLGAIVGGGALIATGGAGAAAVVASPAVVLTTLSGTIVAGPAVAGNGLKVLAFKADGTLLQSASADASGYYTLSYDAKSYTGAVLLKVIDTNAGVADYMNEATALGKSLDSNIYAIVVPTSGSSNTVNITPLTSLAAKLVGINTTLLNAETGDGITGVTTAAHIAGVNNAVAKEYAGVTGAEQITELTPTPVISSDGAAQIGNDYGYSLAKISSMESSNAKTTAQVIDALLTKTTFDVPTSTLITDTQMSPLMSKSDAQGVGTMLDDGLMSLVEANQALTVIVRPGGYVAGQTVELQLGNASFATPKTYEVTENDVLQGSLEIPFTVSLADLGADGLKKLTAVIKDGSGFAGVSSDPITFTLDTTVAAPAVNAIAADNIINLAESAAATVTGSNELGATVDLLIGGVHRAATVTGTTWAYTLVAADMTNLGQGVTNITATQTDAAGNPSTSTVHAVEIDTAAPTAPAVNAIAADNIINLAES